MPAGPSDIGITEASDVLTQSVEIEAKLDEVVRKNSTGGFAVAQGFDPKRSGSIKILGATEDEVGSDLTTALASLAGLTIIKEKTHTRTQDNFDETDVSFENFPGAGGS